MSKIDEILEQTNNLHEMIKLPDDIDKEELNKKIIAEKEITGLNWKHEKRGSLEIPNNGDFILKAPARYDTWAPDDFSNGDYVGYGITKASLRINHENWEDYNRLAFTIYSECENIVNPNVIFEIHNQGKQKIPDQYNREGYHVINLKNRQEKTYFLNISDLPRDEVCKIGFSWSINGSYMNLPGSYKIKLVKISLQKITGSVSTKGWQQDKISYSHDGYNNYENKVAVVAGKQSVDKFSLIDAKTENTVFDSKSVRIKNSMGNFTILDFTDFNRSGEYRIQYGDFITQVFKIGNYEKLWSESIPKVLNFFYGERCGYPISGIHGTCHEDVIAQRDGGTISYNGGWHDAGDVSQQMVHSAEATQALFKIAGTVTDNKLSKRLVEEGNWGLDFIFKTDMGDGFHATSAGVSRWTDNRIGTMDDAEARVHDNPYENFLLSDILADIAQQSVIDDDMELRLNNLAIQYFDFAMKRFEKSPYEKEPIMWEHTYNTSKATYVATIVAAAGNCYTITNKESYLLIAIEFMDKLLACQEINGIELFDGKRLSGMFYRDEQHRVFQHFNHQSREMLFARAFEVALKLPVAKDLLRTWKDSAKKYGDYLLYLKQFTYPYPMIASGIYLDTEGHDKPSFDKQHLLIDDSAYKEYEEQLKQGVQIAKHLYIRRFPVWFSFRGNDAIILSTGNSAAILGKVLHNQKLMDLANAQLRWIVGNNPFDQSLMFGEGNNYQQEYSNSSGDFVGELPVGIETKDNEDVPYWPQFNNATYKEVWIVAATKWLSVISELIKG